MYSESTVIQRTAAEEARVSVRELLCVCVCVGGCCITLTWPPLLSAAYQATVAAVVNPHTAGMWIEKFSQPRIQDQITLVPVSTLIIRKMETLTSPMFCGLETL